MALIISQKKNDLRLYGYNENKQIKYILRKYT